MATEQDISEIIANRDALCQEVEEMKSAHSLGSPADDKRVARLVQLNANLEAKVKVISFQFNKDTYAVS